MNHSIDRVGNLIGVCGNSGSGKSTLVRYALQKLPEKLSYMNTFTTRQRRLDEDDTEYTFVNDNEYEQYQRSAKVWDESTIYGNRYGVDADRYIEALNRGENIIFCTIPSNVILTEICSIYGRSVLKTIHLKTGAELSAEQAMARDQILDIGRVALDTTLSTSTPFNADYSMSPSGSLEIDQVNFLNIVRRIVL